MHNFSSSPLIFNTVFASNIGYGMENVLSSSSNIFYATFVNNTEGGMINGAATPKIRYSIMWDYGSEIVTNFSSPAIIEYSCIKGGYAGIGNIDSYSQFLDSINLIGPDGIWMTSDDGLQLAPCSPAINSGDTILLPFIDALDITGSPRIQNTYVDMGAYESPFVPPISINNLGYSTLSQAVSAAALSGGTVEIGPCTIESPSITIPMNVLLNIALGASLTIVP